MLSIRGRRDHRILRVGAVDIAGGGRGWRGGGGGVFLGGGGGGGGGGGPGGLHQRRWGYWFITACSRMFWLPVSIQMVLWTMRSMIASAWTPEPRRWCQSFFAYWVQKTVEVVS